MTTNQGTDTSTIRMQEIVPDAQIDFAESARIKELEAQVEALRKDAAYLKVIERGFVVIWTDENENHLWAYRNDAVLRGPTLRDAFLKGQG